MLKACDEDCEGHRELEKADVIMRGIAERINEAKGRKDLQQYVALLQTRLIGRLICCRSWCLLATSLFVVWLLVCLSSCCRRSLPL